MKGTVFFLEIRIPNTLALLLTADQAQLDWILYQSILRGDSEDSEMRRVNSYDDFESWK